MKKSSAYFYILSGLISFAFSYVVHSQEASASYSLTDVAKHATDQDCWMAIEGKVYDLSKYIESHPGGPNMAGYCGFEASDAMRTKEIGDDHSPEAWEDLNKYLIGTLK